MRLTTIKVETPGLRNPGVFFFLGFLTLSLAGCATRNPYQTQSPLRNYPSSFTIQDVPFFPQDEFQCGPSSLASVLQYWGYRIGPEDISKAIYLGNIKGTLNIDMAGYAKRFEEDGKLSISEVKGDIELLKSDIARGYPVVVFADLGFWEIRKGHYMLIVGYDDSRSRVIAYSGVEKDKIISYNRFMRIWGRGGYWALRMIPR